MEKLKLIYNPVAGNKSFSKHLDSFIKKFQDKYELRFYRTKEKDDFKQALENLTPEEYRALLIAGGDGTISRVVNAVMLHDIKIPLGIIPAGTSNDFASYIDMPSNYNDCFDFFLNNNLNNSKPVDVGKINDRYFINVCMGGLLSKIPHNTDSKLKNKLGKIAYYFNGLIEFPDFKPMQLRITTSSRVIEENLYLFLILNSNQAGGFENLSKSARIDDELFDLIAVKEGKFHEISTFLIELFQNKHLENENFIYLQDKYFHIESLDDNNNYSSDIDGEKGPQLPLEITVQPKALNLLYNKV